MLEATFVIYTADGRVLGEATVPLEHRAGDHILSHLYPTKPIVATLTAAGRPDYVKVRFLGAWTSCPTPNNPLSNKDMVVGDTITLTFGTDKPALTLRGSLAA